MNEYSPFPPQLLARCRAFSMGFALLALCIGVAALLGWIFDNELLKRVHPALVTMKANTSVCLILVAVSALLVNSRALSRSKQNVVYVIAVVVALVGLITLSEHIFGWNTGLDQLLFHLIRDGKDHDLARACSPKQRAFIATFLEYVIEQYSAELDECTYSDDMLKAYDIWSVG